MDTIFKIDCGRVEIQLDKGSKQADKGWNTMFRATEAEEVTQAVSIE